MRSTLILVLLLVFAGCDQQQDLGHSENLSCQQGLTRCGSRCVDPLSEPEHCGACDRACPAATLCQAGACVSSCSDSYSACSRSCVKLYQEDSHCGACNKACLDMQHCDNAVCATCGAGTTACLLPSTQSWRCINLATDNLHCGRCEKSCPQGQQCASGACS